jgi:hypothetical protein
MNIPGNLASVRHVFRYQSHLHTGQTRWGLLRLSPKLCVPETLSSPKLCPRNFPRNFPKLPVPETSMTRRTSPASPYKADGESAGQLSGHCESSLEAAALWAGVSPGRQANSSARLRAISASDGRGEGAGSRYGAKVML